MVWFILFIVTYVCGALLVLGAMTLYTGKMGLPAKTIGVVFWPGIVIWAWYMKWQGT